MTYPAIVTTREIPPTLCLNDTLQRGKSDQYPSKGDWRILAQPSQGSEMREHLYYYKVTDLVSVYDGDSFRVVVSLGRRLKDEWPCRLARVNALEMRDADPAAKAKAYEARDYLRARLEAAMAAGVDVIIHSVKLEKYGRALAELYIDSVNINDELVEKGYAQPYGD